MVGSIAAMTRLCAQSFRQVREVLDQPQHEINDGISASAINDELERFQIWAGNIGASQESRTTTSLEARLRDASEITEQISQLLEDLREALEDSECPEARLGRS